MITRQYQFCESQVSAREPRVHDPALENELYDMFLKMRDLLEDYAPSWYSEELRARAESIVRDMKK